MPSPPLAWTCSGSNNDELVEASDKTRLCVWQTISDDELSPVLKDAFDGTHMPVAMHTVNAAKSLIRWCLKGDPAERPTVEEILGHTFLNPESTSQSFFMRPFRNLSDLLVAFKQPFSNLLVALK